MDTPITRAEHEEFRRRLEEGNQRQDRRITLLEESQRRLESMSTSIEKLAINMENMCKEQQRQGSRLEILEGKDGKMWRKVVEYAITAAVGICVGYLFTHIGL